MSNYHCPAHYGFARWCKDCVRYSNALRAADRAQRKDPTLTREKALELVQEDLPEQGRVRSVQ